MTDLMTYARFQLGDGTSQRGERILSRESLDRMQTAQAHKQSTDDDIGLGWHLRRVGGVRTASHGGTLSGHNLLLELAPDRQFAIAILTNSNVGWRVIQDVEREALRTYLGVTYAPNQGIAHRGVLETLPSAMPLATQPLLDEYAGTFARPSNTVVVRVDGATLALQVRPTSGPPTTEMHLAFFGKDRAVVLDGPDQGQAVEFVRDGAGRVSWVRVTGRVAIKTS
jgi:hypothetical protein